MDATDMNRTATELFYAREGGDVETADRLTSPAIHATPE